MTPRLVMKWPLQLVLDSHDRPTGWVVVHAPVVSPQRQAVLADLLRFGARFAGMSSDMSFPGLDAKDSIDYTALCEVWCHCFRDPERRLPPNAPRTLLSASDFTDYVRVTREAANGAAAPDYDFVYIGATDAWKQEAKGWPLALRCLPALCGEFGLRGLLVDTPREGVPLLPTITLVPRLPWGRLLSLLASARFLFVPNELDASPRVIAEALSLDVPIVVNRRILGGWKYVTSRTGVFFDSERDVVGAADSCLRGSWSARAWFRSHHGPYLAGRRLLRLLREVDPSITEQSHLRLAERVGAGAPEP
jgi:hypothetical protein